MREFTSIDQVKHKLITYRINWSKMYETNLFTSVRVLMKLLSDQLINLFSLMFTWYNNCEYVFRIKKLIDIEALGLSRLQVIVLDMHTDVKGYSLLSLPQIRLVTCPIHSLLYIIIYCCTSLVPNHKIVIDF